MSIGEKTLSFFFSSALFLYFCNQYERCFESDAKQSVEISTVAKSLPQILSTTQTAFI